MSVEKILEERQKQHGSFNSHAEIELALREFAAAELEGKTLTPVQTIGLGMILHKVARILNNGHDHIDSWSDIAGYATLVEKDMTNVD